MNVRLKNVWQSMLEWIKLMDYSSIDHVHEEMQALRSEVSRLRAQLEENRVERPGGMAGVMVKPAISRANV
jgi:SMC interacting uncharacterized protein involved in chromosome segregation